MLGSDPPQLALLSAMKLKTFPAKDRSNSYEYFRGLPVSGQLDPSARAEIEEELSSIEIEAFTPDAHELPSREIGSDAPNDRGTRARRPLRSPRLIGERAHRLHFLDAHAVDYLQVDGNYVTIYVGDDRYLTRSTLKHLSDVLAPYDFIRIDRSVLLNLRQVDYVERLESGQFSFRLRRGQQLVSNRERSSAIARLLRSGVC